MARTAACAPACAPACTFTCADAEVVIRYQFAGAEYLVPLPIPVWSVLVGEARTGRFARLGATPQRWEGGLARGFVFVAEGYVELIHGHVHVHRVRLPASVWEQVVAAMRSHALDHLTAVTTTPGS